MENYNAFIEMDAYTLIKGGVWLGSIALAGWMSGKNDSSDTNRSTT